jgi:Ca2+-dependent lipid-binding protein
MGCFGSKERDLNAVGLAINDAYGGQVGRSDDDPSAAIASVLGHSGAATARVELTIKCNGLRDKDIMSKSDPMVVVSKLNSSNQWVEVGRTEIVANNLNPVFMRRVVTSYHFEDVQKLRFDIYDVDSSFKTSDPRNIDIKKQDTLGSSEALLGDILRQPGSTWTGTLSEKGKTVRGNITVQAEQLANSNVDIWMKLRCANLQNIETFGNIEPFIRISRLREDGSYSAVYKTEVKKGKNPVFQEISAPLLQLSNGDMFRPLKFEVVDYERSGKHRVLGK